MTPGTSECTYTYTNAHTQDHRDSSLHSTPCNPATRAYVLYRPTLLLSRYPLAFALSSSYGYSLSSNKSPTSNPPTAVVVGLRALHGESNRESFHPLPMVGQPHPERGKISSTPKRGERVRAYRRYTRHSAAPPTPLVPIARTPRRFARLFILGNFNSYSPLAPPDSLPILPPNPALSTYRMLRHSGEIYGYFAKWLNAPPDYGRGRICEGSTILWSSALPSSVPRLRLSVIRNHGIPL